MFDFTKPFLLCVDDDQDILAQLEAYLQENYNVVTAQSGPAGLDVLTKVKPDLILLDIMMPEMDGYEVSKRLQSNPDTAWIPIIFISALDEEQDKARAFAAGAVDYLVKPISKESVNLLIEKHRTTKELWEQSKNSPKTDSPKPLDSSLQEFLSTRFLLKGEAAQKLGSTPDSNIYQETASLGIDGIDTAMAIAEYKGVDYLDFINPNSIKLGGLPTPFSKANHALVITKEREDYLVLSNPYDMLLQDSLSAVLEPSLLENIIVTDPENIDFFFDLQPIPYITDRIITVADKRRASDIRLEAREDLYEVRLRIDGELIPFLTLDKNKGYQVVSRFKVLSGMDIAEKRRTQDGAYNYKIGDKSLRLRVASSASPQGETISIRILDASARPISLDKLGMTPEQTRALTDFASRDQGLILVVGPTGAGKTTTIYSLLSQIDTISNSLVSVEDPIEYNIQHANQQQVNEKAGITFESLLKASMRQDPDILFVGEVRDPYSAKVCIDFASTGHLTMTTLHTSNVTTALFRLERLGVSKEALTGSLTGIVAQRLLRKLCPHCKDVRPITDAERNQLALYSKAIPETLAHPKGCIRCSQTGFLGREGVYEVIPVDMALAELIGSNASPGDIRDKLRHQGQMLLVDHALIKLAGHSIYLRDVYEKILVEEKPLTHLVTQNTQPEILVVDDDEDHTQLVTHWLNNMGYSVTTASDGVDALFRLATTSFDLIISDIDMPNLDGLKLLELNMLKGIGSPVLLISGSSKHRSADIQSNLDLGAAGFLRKPFNKTILLEEIRRIL